MGGIAISRVLIIEKDRPHSLPLAVQLGRRGLQPVFAPSPDVLEDPARRGAYQAAVFSDLYALRDSRAACERLRPVYTIPMVIQIPASEKRRLRDLKKRSAAYFIESGKPEELARRLAALIERNRFGGELRADGLCLLCAQRRLLVDGREVHLAPREFDLLACLMQNRGVWMTGEQLLSLVWRDAGSGYLDSLHTHIASLRGKLGPYRGRIVSRRGTGYLFLQDSPARLLNSHLIERKDR